MYLYDKIFASEKEKYDFVNACDKDFFGKIADAADNIAKDKHIRFILLAGPSCSGKTSATEVITKTLIKDGRGVLSVSIDDFFKDSAQQKKQIHNADQNIDFESIKALDYEYFCECVKLLKELKPTAIPTFDFVMGRRSAYRTMHPDENTIIIFEGIQAVYPEITRLFNSDECKSVFICVDTDVNAYGSDFTKRQLRFARRLVRDNLFRGADAQLTFRLWKGVVENEEVNIMPYAAGADIRINSFVPYEVNVLAPFVKKVLAGLPDGSEYSQTAKEFLKKYENVPEITHKYVPENSFFTEFIGKE